MTDYDIRFNERLNKQNSANSTLDNNFIYWGPPHITENDLRALPPLLLEQVRDACTRILAENHGRTPPKFTTTEEADAWMEQQHAQ